MSRGYNFGAGPAMLPEALLGEVKSELMNWQDLGMSVMEIGHRTPEYLQLMTDAERLLRKLLTIPDEYHILFLGAPARLQFGMVPLNLINEGQEAGYLITGAWSAMAFEEACRTKNAYCIASSKDNNFLSIPSLSEWVFKKNSAYLYYTPNETIDGVRCSTPPKQDGVPLVADMTSCLLSEPLDINEYGLIFAGAQKNIANAGLTLVIIHNELVKNIQANGLTTMLDYRTYVNSHSLYATPPTFNCYIALKMFQWVEQQGGVEALHAKNKEKAQRLYSYIDASSFYHCDVATDARSLVNVCFSLARADVESLFLEKATQNNLLALKGHRSKGGLRASMYNSMPIEGVDLLIKFMDNFAKRYA